MDIINKLKNNKLNIIVGDYYIKKAGFLSRTELGRIFSIEFPEDKKNYIENINSFSDVSQTYLDLAIGNKKTLLNKLKDLYTPYKNPNNNTIYKSTSINTVTFDDFLVSDNVATVINFDYDDFFEKGYNEIVNKITLTNLQRAKGKISLFKVFGDILNFNNIIISNQDIRKYRILDIYKPYFKALQEELYERDTYIFGLDINNPDILNIFEFILSTCDKEKLKSIYYEDVEGKLNEESMNFLFEHNIEIVTPDENSQILGTICLCQDTPFVETYEDIQLTLLGEPEKEEDRIETKIECEIVPEICDEIVPETLEENSTLVFEEIIPEEIKESSDYEIIDEEDDDTYNEDNSDLNVEKIGNSNDDSIDYSTGTVKENSENEETVFYTPEINLDFPEKKIEFLEPISFFVDLEDDNSDVVSEERKTTSEIFQEDMTSTELPLEPEPIIVPPAEIIDLKTAAELNFYNMGQISNPIFFSNADINESSMTPIKIETSSLRIGLQQILVTKLQLLTSRGLNLLEIRTREFHIKISVDITKDGMISRNSNFLQYGIVPNINQQRFEAILDLLKGFFEGDKIFFKDNKYLGTILFINQREKIKLTIIRELNNVYNQLSFSKDKKFNQVEDSYYIIYLLSNLEKSSYETWGNFSIIGAFDPLDTNLSLETVREYQSTLKGLENRVLRETITVIDTLDNGVVTGDKTVFKQKKLRIKVELI